MLSLYDTRRARRAVFRIPQRPVTLYVCGITPYDTTHLGHARTFLLFDILLRHLEAAGRKVHYVQNVTDIDESILQRAARDGESWRALGQRYERGFLVDMRALGWRPPNVMPHARARFGRCARWPDGSSERGTPTGCRAAGCTTT
jgi:L-cysteine:1D-myo-inositol 2-amino-2-deoxy-alpha-D-glucopyranoside ligase